MAERTEEDTAEMLKQFRSSSWSRMIERAVPKRQQTLNEMVGAAGLVTKDVEVKNEGQVKQVVNMAEPVVLVKLGPHVIEAMRSVQEAMLPVYSLRNVDL